ncbi:uncharacterized protein ACO6RY_05587 [Pungitius sinensis]
MSFLFGHSLDMAKDSVDDMYNGCSPKMEANAKSYLQAEMKDDPVLKKSWMDAQALQKEEPPAGMTKEQMIALYAYTSGEGDLKKQFNKANREQGLKNYKKGFKYHALHFYLSTAVQALKAEHDKSTEDNDKKCYTVFRRTDASFGKKVLKKEVRFGSFTSASLNKDLVVSGDKSCFEVYTCMGADVSKHTLHEHKAEVLIPPYEVFKVKKITEKSEQQDLWCDVVYELKSTQKPVSNFNCALIPK